jgi:hypothetical protein
LSTIGTNLPENVVALLVLEVFFVQIIHNVTTIETTFPRYLMFDYEGAKLGHALEALPVQ